MTVGDLQERLRDGVQNGDFTENTDVFVPNVDEDGSIGLAGHVLTRKRAVDLALVRVVVIR